MGGCYFCWLERGKGSVITRLARWSLPFLMTTLSFIASALHKPLALNAELRRKQVINMILLAVVFFVLFYTFPAGMVLYWTTNNLISVSKSLWARR